MTPRPTVSDNWLFFRAFCRKGTEVGSIVPSSSWFARAMVRDIAWSETRCVVELGAGTGAVTAELLKVAPKNCRCVIVERDSNFCARLRERFPDAEIVEADARDLTEILRQRGIASADHILSCLALPWFTPEGRRQVLDSSRRLLLPGGTLRQMTYMPWVHYRTYYQFFERVTFRWVVRNVPPGGFYLCGRPRLATP